ncbi:class I SAM-dependent methyltransferase [Spirillospora sp. NPDC050679]
MTVLSLLVTAAVLGGALRLRRRLATLRRAVPGRVAGASPGHAAGSAVGRGAAPPDGEGETYGLVAVEGAVVSGQIRRAAQACARDGGLQVLDLVPADLPVERALDLARSVDLVRYRTDPLAAGRGAGFAMLASDEVLRRADVRPGTLDVGAFGELTARLRQYARTADLAVVPCRTTPRVPACRGRRAWLRGLGVPVPLVIARSALGWLAVVAVLLADPRWGPVAALAYCAVPYVVFAGTPLSPRDLHRTALLRLVAAPWSWWRTLADPPSAWERRLARREEQARERYRAEYVQGVRRFLEPRRPDCPWCGSRSLAEHVTSGDVVQRKPGTFTLERCRDCGHVFQNPRLTREGLDFYYRDAYDGLGAAGSERLFALQGDLHRARAELVAAHTEPRAWLDVGAGHGHFCRVAGAVLPGTAFDGLDLGAGVREGARRGWLRNAHQGRFPELLDRLTGRYDVVSMHHYLEHTPDPRAELDAAVKLLGPGGHLLVELPDPESRLGRPLGRHWMPWLQPQHLNMMPIGNLEQALAARGMRIVARERRAAHQRYDLTCAATLALSAFGPCPDRPWAPRPATAADRARRALALAAAVPLVGTAMLLDRLVVPLLPGTSNAYRVLARKDEG